MEKVLFVSLMIIALLIAIVKLQKTSHLDRRSAMQRKMDGIPQQISREVYEKLYNEKYNSEMKAEQKRKEQKRRELSNKVYRMKMNVIQFLFTTLSITVWIGILIIFLAIVKFAIVYLFGG